MQWSKTYGGPDYDLGYSVVQTADGGYALTGETRSYGTGSYDIWLVKTNANGNMQWAKTYGGTHIDAGHSLVQTPDAGFAIACWSDFWLVKTDSMGNMQWNMGSGSAWSIVKTDDSGLAVAGDRNHDFWLVKLARVSDASVADVSPSRNWTYQGRAINVSVTVANLGDYADATVSLYYNGTAGNGLIGTKRVAVSPNDTATLTFTWDTTGISPCYSGYSITGAIDISPVIDVNLTSNALQSPLAVQVRILGDLNVDGKVDIKDLAFVGQFFGSYADSIISPRWNADTDINADGKVDIRDLTLIAKNFGKTYP
jgi:hypothetical protein